MSRGFTLVEVLVALAVVAVGVGAAVATATRQADSALALQERSFAHWACENLVARWRLADRWPAPGTYTATGEQAGRAWPLEIEVVETRSPRLRQLRVRARQPGRGERTVTTLTAFLVKPREPAEANGVAGAGLGEGTGTAQSTQDAGGSLDGGSGAGGGGGTPSGGGSAEGERGSAGRGGGGGGAADGAAGLGQGPETR